MLDLLKLVAVFAAIVLLLRRRVNLGLVMLLGSLAVAALWAISPAKLLAAARSTVTDRSTLQLMLILWMVSLLEKILNETGQLERMIRVIERVVPGRRLRLVIMPAFLGLLPSPGGAMFSAPFVQKAAENMGLTGEQKTFVNYWFRHVWEYVLPIYPGTILATTLLGVTFPRFFMTMYPCTVAALAGGVLFGLLPLKLPREETAPARGEPAPLWDLLAGIAPVLLILLLVLALRWDLALSFALVLALHIAASRIALRSLPGLVRASISLQVIFLVLGVLFFKDLLQISGAAAAIVHALSSAGIPPLPLFCLIPFFLGLLTGVTPAYIAIAFPLLLGMASGQEQLPLFAFAFLWGFIGVILSPLHLCLVLTAEYFGVTVTSVYRYLILPALLLAALSLTLIP